MKVKEIRVNEQAIVEIHTPHVEVQGQSYELMVNDVESTAKICYQSQPRPEFRDKEAFIRNTLLNNGHYTPLEDSKIKVKILCSRAVSHQLVRYRLTSPMQQSHRYTKSNVFIIDPSWNSQMTEAMVKAAIPSYLDYYNAIDKGISKDDARRLLPNGAGTVLQIVANIREWRHVLEQRISSHASSETRYIANSILTTFEKDYPVFFRDIRKVSLINEKMKRVNPLLLNMSLTDIDLAFDAIKKLLQPGG